MESYVTILESYLIPVTESGRIMYTIRDKYTGIITSITKISANITKVINTLNTNSSVLTSGPNLEIENILEDTIETLNNLTSSSSTINRVEKDLNNLATKDIVEMFLQNLSKWMTNPNNGKRIEAIKDSKPKINLAIKTASKNKNETVDNLKKLLSISIRCTNLFAKLAKILELYHK